MTSGHFNVAFFLFTTESSKPISGDDYSDKKPLTHGSSFIALLGSFGPRLKQTMKTWVKKRSKQIWYPSFYVIWMNAGHFIIS